MNIKGAAEYEFKPGFSMEESAIALAITAHWDQKRKDGSPYIFHPLRVMLAFNDVKGRIGRVMRASAVLHDVVEDCDITVDEIATNVGLEVALIVERLTRRKGEVYADYIVRVATDDVARRVKIADVADNLSTVDEIPDPDEAKSLRRRYEWTLGVLR